MEAKRRITEILNRLPLTVIALAYMGWVGYSHWSFLQSPQSELGIRRAKLESVEREILKAQDRKRQAELFFKSLEQKKAEVRLLQSQLQNMRGSLSDEIDVGEFLRTVVTEAKKVGLKVLSFKPNGSEIKGEFFSETQFTLRFQGLFIQTLVFLNRISELNRIIRIEGYKMAPQNSLNPNAIASGKFTELDGQVTLSTYRYAASKADEVKNGENTVK